MVNVGEVHLWNHLVGAVLWDENDETGSFEFDPDFCRLGLEISPIHMPAIDGEVYTFPALSKQTYKGLPGCLADSLPDDFGNALINAWCAQNGRDPRSFNPVERLLYQSTRGMGALEYRPAIGVASGKSDKLELNSLVEMAAKVLSDRNELTGEINLAPTSGSEDAALQHLFQMGTSAGGARPKAVLAMNDKGEFRSGQVEAPPGYTYWLLKFDVSKGATVLGDPAGFGRIEYAYYRMARAAGIAMTECRLHQEGGRAHFMTRRFDRTDEGKKLHSQTLCGLDHADFMKPGMYSYEEALQVLRQLQLSREDQIELYRRMVFNVIARNQDDHTKNTSFLMDYEGNWMLSPAYDIAWSYKSDSPWVATHQMTINGKRDGFALDDLRAVASQIPRFNPDEVIAEVREAVLQWPAFADEAGVDEPIVDMIASTHRLSLA